MALPAGGPDSPEPGGLTASPAVVVSDDSGRVPMPYCIPAHAETTGLPHATVEIRQDLIDTHHGAEAWAHRVADALVRVLLLDLLDKKGALRFHSCIRSVSFLR